MSENTELVTLNTKGLSITPSPELQNQLQEITTKAQYTEQILTEYRTDPEKFMESNDEESIQSLTTELSDVLKVVKKRDDDRKALKKQLKTRSDSILKMYDDLFKGVPINELLTAKSDLQTIKSELQFRRKDARWAEVKPVFEESMAHHPNIHKYAPELTDFARFRIMNEKLISGAKKQNPVMKTVLKTVRELIADMNSALDLMIENAWGLEGDKQTILLGLFKNNPTSKTVLTEAPHLKEQQIAEAEQAKKQAEEQERQRIEAEKRAQELKIQQAKLAEEARIAKLKQDALQQEAIARQQEMLKKQQEETAQRQKELNEKLSQFKNQFVSNHISDKYPLYIEDLFKRLNATNQELHNNDRAKANELYHVMSSVTDPNSIISKSTQLDPGRILEIVRFVLDM